MLFRSKGLPVDSILDIAPHVYSGHFHIRQRREYGSKFINYVGNPFEMNFADANDPKGFYIIDVQNDTEEFIPNKLSPVHHKLYASKILNEDLSKKADEIKNNIIRLVVDAKITADVIDKLQHNINLHKPASCTVEFLLNINAVDMLKDISADMIGINIENSIAEFVNNLDITDKKQLIEECITYYKNIK